MTVAYASGSDKRRRSSSLNPCHPGRPFFQLEPIPVAERLRELFLVTDEQNALQVPAEVVQLLNHHLPAVAVEAAEPLVDDHRLDRPVLPAGVLADAERETHSHAES